MKMLNEFFEVKNPAEYKHTEVKMIIAAKIDAAMKAKGMGKKEFAIAIKQQPSVITRWLSGNHNFTIETLCDIENVLKIKLIYY